MSDQNGTSSSSGGGGPSEFTPAAADGGVAAKLPQLPIDLEENIVRDVLGFLWIGEKAQREIIDRLAVRLVKLGKLRVPRQRAQRVGRGNCDGGFIHTGVHCFFDKAGAGRSRGKIRRLTD